MRLAMFLKVVPLFLFSATASAQNFIEAAPLSGRVKDGEVPRQFTLKVFNKEFLCEDMFARPKKPSWPSLPSREESVRVFCDASRQLAIREGDKFYATSAFFSSTQCQKAREEFMSNGACFCSALNTVTCFTRGSGLKSYTNQFFSNDQCTRALAEYGSEFNVTKR